MFEVIEQQFDKHVVIPDGHGEHKKVLSVVEQYYDYPDVGYVFLGDMVDRKGVTNDPEQGVRETLQIVKNLGERAIVTMANHEWMLLGAVFADSIPIRDAIAKSWLLKNANKQFGSTSIESNTLSSYDLTNTGIDSVARLWREMRQHGHTKVLTNATPYYETDTFIAVHAGVGYEMPWEDQKYQLELTGQQMANGEYWEQPDQWFSIELAIDARPVTTTDKTVVSGHAHYLIPDGRYKKRVKNFSPDRIINEGSRVRLASQLNPPQNQPLIVWQDWDGKLTEHRG
jgi:hypothetical protein